MQENVLFATLANNFSGAEKLESARMISASWRSKTRVTRPTTIDLLSLSPSHHGPSLVKLSRIWIGRTIMRLIAACKLFRRYFGSFTRLRTFMLLDEEIQELAIAEEYLAEGWTAKWSINTKPELPATSTPALNITSLLD